MRQLGSGDKQAFNALYSRYSKKLGWYFYKMLNMDHEKANDFVQDLFMKIIEDPMKFDQSKRFSTWVYTIASNMCKNEYRRMGVRFDHQGEVEATYEHQHRSLSPEESTDMTQFSERLQAVLNTFPPDNKTIFLMKHYEGYSLKEIAEALGVKEGTVKSRLFYTMKKLEDALSDYKK